MQNITLLDSQTDERFPIVAGDYLLNQIAITLQKFNTCFVGLSGGGTPKPIYEWLGKQTSVDWSKVTFFIVDERYIDAADSRSNTKMIRDKLLSGGEIKEDNVIFPDTSLSIEDCISNYEERLKNALDNNSESTIIVLGMGGDGHIASIFPPVESKLLDSNSCDTIFHTQTTKFDVKDRFTISLERIAQAGTKIFFLHGSEKKTVWEDMKNSEPDNYERWPALYVMKNNVIAITYFP